jgi:hypothetical protein
MNAHKAQFICSAVASAGFSLAAMVADNFWLLIPALGFLCVNVLS